MLLQYYINIHKISQNNSIKEVVYIITRKKTNYQVAPFLNNNIFLESTRSLSDGPLSAIIDASIFCLRHLIDEAGRRTFQVNE